ncbi:MAG: AAA family ATPase [Candidatus Saccharibacteria bacterium]|nr:AAA family ATPase [Rhodoferax sp.]
MVRRDSKDLDEAPGFTRYWQDTSSKGILLPIAVVEAAVAERKSAVTTAMEKFTLPVLGGKPLPKIRINTDQDIADATAFAKKFLKNAVTPALLSAQVSQDLLVAVLLVTAYKHPEHGMLDVLHYPVDPLWDNPRQLLNELRNDANTSACSGPAALWLTGFVNQVESIFETERTATDLLKAANLHWSKALNKPKRRSVLVETVKSSRTIQVFSAEALEKAVVAITDMNSERRDAGVRILEQARVNQGNRTLPEARQASKNLEATKLNFENLLEPIERLQTDLVLVAAMRPEEFRISPILLLGQPGIGKTYLASQLAEALGVPTEKISAGGAQGGFQLAGSHGAWTGAKPGLIAAMLAKSASAAPVLVIDEVDKIYDAKYPFLPVLLDLLDAGTAKRFKDEYCEMEFDASRIIVVLTANDISGVPPPLLSRVEVFTVPPPEPSQRLRIIQQTMTDLCGKTNQRIGLGPGVAERLADRMDIDLRQLNRMVRAAFATALQAGNKVVRIRTADYPGKNTFNLRAWKPEREQLS